MVRADDDDVDDAFDERSSDCATFTSGNKSYEMILSSSDDGNERGWGQQFRHLHGIGTVEVQADEDDKVCSETRDGISTRNNLGFRKTRRLTSFEAIVATLVSSKAAFSVESSDKRFSMFGKVESCI